MELNRNVVPHFWAPIMYRSAHTDRSNVTSDGSASSWKRDVTPADHSTTSGINRTTSRDTLNGDAV
eukprot:scaffold385862_cov25-Prasinocladus_malaysianus.AAC.1